MRYWTFFPMIFTGFICTLSIHVGIAQTKVVIQLDQKQQIIDGFGAHQGSDAVNETWWQDLFFEDMEASIYRVDLTPVLTSPYADLSYFSPWFMGGGNVSVFNFEDPANPDGPEGNRVRTYTGPEDYGRLFGGEEAPISVMGPDIDANVSQFEYSADGAIRTGLNRKEDLGDFKLIGSLWSPVPWVKVSSGNTWGQDWWPGPVQGAAWPFIWGGNFAGGRLDVSDAPLDVFNDADLGGEGATSALTQFARSTAAYIKGYQDYHGVQFYAISIQNELNFEQFYNSATYPLAQQYITALKSVRAAFDQDPALKNIRIMGPEDLLGGDPYGMWQYGGGQDVVHKNLQYLEQIGQDPDALNAIDFFCIHGYGDDGVEVAGASSTLWDWWVNGWSASPAAGIPGNVKGFSAFNKKSWMTETSGERPEWLWPESGYPSDGAWSLGLRIHQALTTGQQSAWVYWTFSGSEDDDDESFALTTKSQGAAAPKYVAAKHYYKYIRPNAQRVEVELNDDSHVLASAYVHDTDQTMTTVLINRSDAVQTVEISVTSLNNTSETFSSFLSQADSYWVEAAITIIDGAFEVTLPPYSLMTITGAIEITTPTSSPLLDTGLRLDYSYPNPAGRVATVRYVVPQAMEVRLLLQDLKGNQVQTLFKGAINAGEQELSFNTSDLPAGMYLISLQAGGAHLVKKLLIGK